MLFLTVSFRSAPYYTGADIVFVFAWTPLILAGSGTVLSADAAVADWARKRARPGGPQAGRSGGRPVTAPEASRRDVMLKGMVTTAVAAASLITGGLAAGLGRLAGGTSGKTGASSFPSAAGPQTAGLRPVATNAAAASSAAAKPGSSPAGQAIGPARDVPVGQAASFQDPASGDPAIVIQPQAGTFLAFDAVCPHAGCTVQYDPSAKIIVCPCHGSQFSASTGAVEVGPAASGLTRIAIAEGANGQLYAS